MEENSSSALQREDEKLEEGIVWYRLSIQAPRWGPRELARSFPTANWSTMQYRDLLSGATEKV
jgi:hypothetical protein